jgi:hypothetical protein
MHLSESDQPKGEAALDQSLTSRSIAWPPLGVGFVLVLGVLFLQTVTLVSEDYTKVLVIALALTVAGDAFLIRAFLLGGVFVRCLSVLFLLPTLFVAADFLRRALHVFHW